MIQKRMQAALQAAEASWNNCTGVLALQKDFHFSDCKSNQIKSNLHFYSTFHTRFPRCFTQKAKPLKCLWTQQVRRASLELRCKGWERGSTRTWHRLTGPAPWRGESQEIAGLTRPQRAELYGRCKALASHTTCSQGLVKDKLKQDDNSRVG